MLRFASVLGVLILMFLVALPVDSASGKTAAVSTATEMRLIDPGWWPTKGTFARDQYVGSTTCRRCHASIVETQKNTSMAHAATAATADAFTNIPAAMRFHAGAFDYLVKQTSTGAEYSATNGQQSATVVLSWVFGDQQFGDTFLYQQNGVYFESRVSYYKLINGLDFTTGHPRFRADRIETALGRRMSAEEPPLCFGCHSTASSTNGQFHPEQL